MPSGLCGTAQVVISAWTRAFCTCGKWTGYATGGRARIKGTVRSQGRVRRGGGWGFHSVIVGCGLDGRQKEKRVLRDVRRS